MSKSKPSPYKAAKDAFTTSAEYKELVAPANGFGAPYLNHRIERAFCIGVEAGENIVADRLRRLAKNEKV